MKLALRRGRVASVETAGAAVELTVEVAGDRRSAIAYPELVGAVEPGDDVVVNTQALDLELGSGGFDIVHVNLTRGLDGAGEPGARAMKLNYTSLQHAVCPVGEGELGSARGRPVAVLSLHGQLEAVAWAAAEARPDARIGFVQTPGGALPGWRSHAVRELRRRGLLAGHVTVGSTFGGEHESLTTAGALSAAFGTLGWDAAIVGPGPGIVGSASTLGHGGLEALDSAHVALALGARTIVVPRLSSGDPRHRHRGLSHHTATVLELLLRPATVAWPLEVPGPLERGEAAGRHELLTAASDLGRYRAAGLSTHTMGRSIDEDELFFRAALAGGTALGEEIAAGV
jgi:hypothetical protein